MDNQNEQKRRIPIDKEVISDKMYNDLIYAYMQSISHRSPNSTDRYVWKNNFKQAEVSKILKMNLRTFKRKFANLKDKGYVVDNGDVYELPNISEWNFYIPIDTLKYLVDTTTEDVISVYCYLGQLKGSMGDSAYYTKSKLLVLLGYKTKAIVNGEITDVASTHKRDWERINNILLCLNLIGLLEYKEVKEVYNGKNIYKTYYKINTTINKVR